ncbi:hypothetical protein BKA62DRAFT_707424 [Auriculariales sp. MPI-PUGE-AT-0066]|nr:hypothetical protein BKA62DRAFT_707424 [Auriculariales sp. MPI-PUGE-AT-0066]
MADGNTAPVQPQPQPQSKCRLEQLVQYTCDYDEKRRSVKCTPFSRIFRVCQDRPAVEVTAVAQVNEDGAVFVPENRIPKGVHFIFPTKT